MEAMVSRLTTPASVSLKARLHRPRREVLALAFFCALSWAAPGFSQGEATTAPIDLDQMVLRAQSIVRGQVTSVRIEPHPQFPNLQTVVVTLSVSSVLKGAAGPSLTFRQYQWDARDASRLSGYKGLGEVVLFLNPVSTYGLTSTVGMEQGRFRVLPDGKGNRYVINGRDNLGLFNQVPAKAAARGIAFSPQVRAMLANSTRTAALETFEEAVRTLVGTPR